MYVNRHQIKRKQCAIAVCLALASFAAQSSFADPTDTTTPDATDTVVVTAQSRTQQMQNVPIAIQTLSGNELKEMGASNLSDVDAFIPGLSIDTAQITRPEVILRGVGTADFGIGTDSPVGIYTNGVYDGKTGGSLLNFNDIKRVEVLMGPQGTLFGRNAAAGAISIITNDPTNAFEASGLVRVGNEGLHHEEVLLNTPITENLAFRFSAVQQYTDGWVRNTYNNQRMGGDNDWGTRAALGWSDDTSSAILSWEHENMNESGPPVFSMTGGAVNFAGPSEWINPLNEPLSNDASKSLQERVFDGVTLRIEHSLPFADFSSLSSYRHFTSQNWQDADGSSNPAAYLTTGNVESNSTWQQEFKLNGKTKSMDWVLGISGYHERATETESIGATTTSLDTIINASAGIAPYAALTQLANGVGAVTGNAALQNTNLLGLPWQEAINDVGEYKSYAIYGDTIWSLNKDTNLTVGGRFTYDEKSFSWYNPVRTATALDGQLASLNQANFFPTITALHLVSAAQAALLQGVVSNNIEFTNPGSTTSPFSSAASWTNFSPRLLLDKHLSPNQMVYASWSKGYQSGGFDAVNVNGRYNPELVTNIEVGTKGQLPSAGLSYSASLFHYDYTNLQSLTLVPASTSTGIPAYEVVDSDQHAVGIDLAGQLKLSTVWRITSAAEYIDQTYTDYTAPTGVNLNGQPAGTPLWNATLGLAATWGVFDGTGDFNIKYGYKGEQRCNTDTTTQGTCLHSGTVEVGQATQKIDARLGWDAPSKNWGIGLVVNNLTNKQYISEVSTLGSAVGSPYAYLTQPRLISLEFKAKM